MPERAFFFLAIATEQAMIGSTCFLKGLTIKNVAVFEAKARFSDLLAAVQAGEEVSITKHGKPVAGMVAVLPDDAASQARQARVQAALRRLAELREGFLLEGDSKEIIA